MSVFRGVYLFRSGDPDYFYVDRRCRKGQECNPDSHVDTLRYADCIFNSNGKNEIISIRNRKTGDVYYTDPVCRVFQE